MAPAPLAPTVALLLAVLTDAPPWRVAAAVVIAVSMAVMAVCLRRPVSDTPGGCQ